jgi:hypothetical protein
MVLVLVGESACRRDLPVLPEVLPPERTPEYVVLSLLPPMLSVPPAAGTAKLTDPPGP